jgi:hypothetical protein
MLTPACGLADDAAGDDAVFADLGERLERLEVIPLVERMVLYVCCL